MQRIVDSLAPDEQSNVTNWTVIERLPPVRKISANTNVLRLHDGNYRHQVPTAEASTSQRKSNKLQALWRSRRRPTRYLRSSCRVGHSETLIGKPESDLPTKSHPRTPSQLSKSSLRRSQLLSSASKRRFKRPKRLKSLDTVIDEIGETRRIEGEEVINRKGDDEECAIETVSESKRNTGSVSKATADTNLTPANLSRFLTLADIYTPIDNAPPSSPSNFKILDKIQSQTAINPESSSHLNTMQLPDFYTIDNTQPSEIVASKPHTPPAQDADEDATSANDHQPSSDLALLPQIDSATIRTQNYLTLTQIPKNIDQPDTMALSEPGEVLSTTVPKDYPVKSDSTSVKSLEVEPAIAMSSMPKLPPPESTEKAKYEHLTANLLTQAFNNPSNYPPTSSTTNAKTSDSHLIDVPTKKESAETASSLRNGFVIRTSSSQKALTMSATETINKQPTTAKMPKLNKVADVNGGADLITTFSTQVTPSSLEKRNFWQRLGFSSIVPAKEKEEFRRNKLSYLHRKLVVDSNEGYFYYWVAAVSMAYVFNLIVVIARSVFGDLNGRSLWVMWLVLDIFSDLIYLLDMFFRSHTGFLEQGLLVRDVKRIKELYYKSRQFKLDLLSVLPLDYIALWVFHQPALFRFNRLLKREQLVKFMEHTETRSSFPNAFRVGSVVWYIAVIIHWNACFYFLISETIGLGSDTWVYGIRNTQSLPEGVEDTLARRYIYSFYWSTLILTTIGEVPGPQENVEFAFVTMDLMCGVLIFATIVGNVGSMISNSNQSRTEFQNRIDSIKQYMELRKVGKQLEMRVIKWFDYLWANKQSLSDQQVLHILPNKLQAEIAMHVHFETLRKVRIFQDCEAGLLAELVLKLQLQVFSPMDYVCRKGDIGREMYIVKRGMLQVVADDGNTVLTTLSEGAVFGELSILNIQGSKNGNRRTANVRSVGYTDLFALNKTDLWSALREYPEARKILITKGRELLRKDNLLDETAPEESKTAEEIADELQSSVRILQTRLARLMAEHISSETKLRDRIDYLETKLSKYDCTIDNQTTEEEWLATMDDSVNEEQIDAERQKLLQLRTSDSESD